MTSEIRANTLKNRVGLGTVSFTNTGPVVSGIVTATSIEVVGAVGDDAARIKIPDGMNGSPFTGNLELGNSRDFVMLHDGHHNYVKSTQNMYVFCGGNNLVTLQTGGSVLLNRDLDVDGHTNLDNVNIAGVTTSSGNISVVKSSGTATISVQSADNYGTLEIGGQVGAFIDLKSPASDDYDIRFVHDGYIYAKTNINLSPIAGYVVNVNKNLNCAEDLDVDGHTNLDNVSIAGVTTASGNLKITGGTLSLDAGGSERFNVAHVSGGTVLVKNPSNAALNFGTNNLTRIQITNDGKVQIGLPGNSTSLPAGTEVVNIRAMTNGNLHIRQIGNIASSPTGTGVGIDVLNDAANTVTDLAIRGSTVIFRSATAETLRIDNTGRLLVGHNANIPVASSNPRFQLTGSSNSTAHLSIRNFSANTTGAILSLAKSRGAIGAYTAVQDDDVIGQINFVGADGTDLAEVAGKILVACDATVANNRVPSRMEFHTTDGNGNLDLNMVLTRDGHLYLPQGITRDAMYNLVNHTADDFILGRTSGNADTGMTLVSPSATSGFINFADADGQRQGSILYQHGNGTDKMFLRTNNNQNALVIDSEQKIGVKTTEPQTELNVIGTISTGRNVARELGTIINVSSEHHSSRAGSNVISGKKNFENGNNDWLAQGGSRDDANLTIDLGSSISCDRFVIYNQNEYSTSHREVKRFTLEGSNDNSSWTTILDDNAGCSNGHEPNPGWSFRIPADQRDDEEGKSYRYWRFTMKDFHGTDSYGGIMELELYQTGTSSNADDVGSEISTHSLVASDVSAGTVRKVGQPAFCVARSGTQSYSVNDTIVFNDDSSNGFFQTGTSPHANYFNTSTGHFYAPFSGVYFFSTTVLVQDATGNYDLVIKTPSRDFYCAPGRTVANAGSTSWSGGTVYLALGGDCITYLKKGQSAEVRFTTYGGGEIYGSGAWTRFQGYLLG